MKGNACWRRQGRDYSGGTATPETKDGQDVTKSLQAANEASQEYLLYTSPPFPHYARTLSLALLKLCLNSTISLIGTVSTFFIGGNPITLIMAGAPVFWILRGQREIQALLKEVRKIYYVGAIENGNDSKALHRLLDLENGRLKIVLFRESRHKDTEPEGRVEWIELKDTKQLSKLYLPPFRNHATSPYQSTWKWGASPYRIDSHGVVDNTNQKLQMNRQLFISENVWGDVFRVKRDTMDKYGFVKIAPVKQLEKLLDWKAKWHVIVDDEIHLLLMKPFNRYYAVDAFCYRGHALSRGKVRTEYTSPKDDDGDNETGRTPGANSKTATRGKKRHLDCTQCPKKEVSVHLRTSSLPVKVIDGYVCIRIDSIYRDVNGGREFLEHTLRQHMTLEEFLSFHSIYK